MSMDGYLDQVTKDLVKGDVGAIYSDRLDRALNLIRERPSLPERVALLSCLRERFEAYGNQKGFLTQSSPGSAANLAAAIVEQIFGYSGKVEDDVKGKLRDKLSEEIENALNSKGKGAFQALNLIYDLANAKNPEEVATILSKCGLAGLASWATKNHQLIVSKLKFVGVAGKTRNQIVKRIAISLKLFGRFSKFLARINIYLAVAQIFFEPSETADSKTEERLAFLFLYNTVRNFDVVERQIGYVSMSGLKLTDDPGKVIKARMQ